MRKRTCRPRLESLDHRVLPSFSPVNSYAVGSDPSKVVSADFNRDGRLDLALANGYVSPSVLLGNGDGTFQGARFTNGVGASALAVGDFNRDGKPDLAAIEAGWEHLVVMLGNGDGTLQAPRYTQLGMIPTSVVVGDLNSDGKMDVAMTAYFAWGGVDPYTGYSYGGSTAWAKVLVGNGDGTFVERGSTFLFDGVSGSSSALADFNRDGRLDLAADGLVLLGNGDGSLQAPRPAPVGIISAAADVNGDGKPDLLGDAVALGNGDGTFQDAQSYEANGMVCSPQVGDFNGDGRLDLVNGYVVVQMGNGDGTFGDPWYFTPGSGPSLAVGDVNGDGRPDVVTADRSAGTITVLINDGAWSGSPLPGLQISDVTLTEGNTGATDAVFTLTLSGSSSQDVTVRYGTAEGGYWTPATAGSDYEPRSGQVTIPAGQTTATVAIPVYGERLPESNESFLVRLSDPTNAILLRSEGQGGILDDEPTISFSPTSFEGNEGDSGTTPFTFTVTLSAASDAPVTVEYATEDYTASASEGDYQASTGTMTFAPGQTSQAITVLVNGDRVAEDTERFFVHLTGSPGAHIDPGAHTAWGSIVDDDPRVNIGNAVATEGNSGTRNLTFTVWLSRALAEPFSVTYATADGGATTAGGDYRATSGTLTFAPGETSKPVTVPVNSDRLGEGDESFFVNLSNPTVPGIGYHKGTGTILDDEPRISVTSVTQKEGKRLQTILFTFTFTLSDAYDQPVTVSFRTADGTAKAGEDYVAKSGTLTFAPGETTKTITIAVLGDNKRESNETFFLDLFGNSSNSLVPYSRGLGVIQNDDGN
jgi:hypothetical protein